MILTLQELAKQTERNTEEYGLKAEGLAELIRRNDGRYVVDPGFALPESFKVEDNLNLKKHLFKLVQGKKEPRLLIARSSDKAEAPGVFDSHTFMFSPGQWKKCYGDLIEAAEKVRASGAGGVVCQLMATKLSGIGFDYDQAPPHDLIEKDCFGADRVGFVGNSWSPFTKKRPVITTAFGLVSKLVRSGERDISIIFWKDPQGYVAINPKGNYRRGAGSMQIYEQSNLDLVFPEDPKKIVNFKTFSSELKGDVIRQVSTPFTHGRFVAGELLSILTHLKTKGREIEIEGDIGRPDDLEKKKPHLFQLRRYNLPENRLEHLTDVNEDRILVKSENTYVADRFSGDLVVLNEVKPWQSYAGQIVAVPDYESIIYSNEKGPEVFKAAVESRAQGLIIPTVSLTRRRYNPAIHELGLMIQELLLLQAKIPVIAMSKLSLSKLKSDHEEFKTRWPDRVMRKPYGTVYLNVTVESNDEKGQIYWN